MPHTSKTTTKNKMIGYIELNPPQLLDDNWRDLKFDLIANQSLIPDIVEPEFGSGFIFHDAHSNNPLTQNRTIFWRTFNYQLELAEFSTEFNLPCSQVRIKFSNSPVISYVNVVEFSNSIFLMIATLTSVHKIQLPHPNTTNKSVLSNLTQDLLYSKENFHLINNVNIVAPIQHPLCSTSWFESDILKFALSYPSGSVDLIEFNLKDGSVTNREIKHTGIIERIWSKMPNLLQRNQQESEQAAIIITPLLYKKTGEWLLFCFCRDGKIRIISTLKNECVHTADVIEPPVVNPLPILKTFGHQMILYLPHQGTGFYISEYGCDDDDEYCLKEKIKFDCPHWESLIDFTVTDKKIWALADFGESNHMICHIDLNANECGWKYTMLNEEIETSSSIDDISHVFWTNRFTTSTITKAVAGLTGRSCSKNLLLEELEELVKNTFETSNDVETSFTKLVEYCYQNHTNTNKVIGLTSSCDERVISVIKRNNSSFITPFYDQKSPKNISAAQTCKCIEGYTDIRISKSLDFVSETFMDEEHIKLFDVSLFENPISARDIVDEVVASRLKSTEVTLSKLELRKTQAKSIEDDIVKLLKQLDMSKKAEMYFNKMSAKLKAPISLEDCYLTSNSGIILTFTMFRKIVLSRYYLCRDILIFIKLLEHIGKSESWALDLVEKLHLSSNVKNLLDCLRSYALMVWISEEPIKKQPEKFTNSLKTTINMISKNFYFFKNVPVNEVQNDKSDLENSLRRNLLMNFLLNGGTQYSSPKIGPKEQYSLSNSSVVINVCLNLCKVLWPTSPHLCFLEFMVCHNLSNKLLQYLNLTRGWTTTNVADMKLMDALCSLLLNNPDRAVSIFKGLWVEIKRTNLIGKIVGLSNNDGREDGTLEMSKDIIHRYYETIIQLFQAYEHIPSLICLINGCIEVLGRDDDGQHDSWINCFKTQLFKYYLETDSAEDAYHAMVLNTDSSQQTICLHQFVVYHSERKLWASLLSYPYVGIRDDFIRILSQRAAMSDLKKQLEEDNYYSTSYYDLLFSFFTTEREYKRAALAVYEYYQRCSLEVRGIQSIRKQVDCLLLCLECLRCIEPQDAYLEIRSNTKENGECEDRNILKRTLEDSEVESQSTNDFYSKRNSSSICEANRNELYIKDINYKFELTNARLKLLENDSQSNTIALSPLSVNEIIAQLVESSMFTIAMDLAVLFKCPMNSIIDGLTAKYIFTSQLTPMQIVQNHSLMRSLSSLFNESYSIISTYTYIANSECSYSEKLWRLISYYLETYDGVSHMNTDCYSVGEVKSNSTLLMSIVARKLLESGYNVPASLKNLYRSRYSTELLRMLIKFNKLTEAADFANEILDKIMQPSSLLISSTTDENLPPVYIPTHLILVLLEYLKEDATNCDNLKIGDELEQKLTSVFRQLSLD